MKFSDKNNQAYGSRGRDVFGVSFHDFIEKEKDSTYVELASEFGITMRDVKVMKKHLNRIE
ncbi:RNA polymerase subunit sigma-70 [Sutcliffiella deserti]|uniref:RNA polymerase subunit sigma-70 n=1 Tax=Sutcliffiella deserti TaxID=2875501 RepID=UPI001CC13AAF|nr:RNA polymerase subunit sigma-70 [Sutcliffiella deserti]